MIATVEREGKLPGYLDFPYDRFLKLRVEFLILTQNELEAKILRVIEWCTENRLAALYMQGTEHALQGQKVVLPDEIWVTISYRFFLEWIYGTVQSETTLKDAIKNLENKYLIFKRPGPGRYDASEFMLNKPLITKLFEQFPLDIADVNLPAIMKQPRKSRTSEDTVTDAGDQKLTPSEIDPLLKKIRETIFDPQNRQFLTPREPKIDPLTKRGGGQKLTPKRVAIKNLKQEKKRASSSYTNIQQETAVKATTAAASPQSLFKNFSLDDLAALKKSIDALLLAYQNNPNATEQSAFPVEEMVAAPNELNDQNEHTAEKRIKRFVEIKVEEVVRVPERPDEHAPRSPETIVQLIEYLRGQRFEQRGIQLRDAHILLSIEPPVSLQEVEEAWQHGSDAYWRERDPLGMTVSDLKNREKISGKPRILACLEHKRRVAREERSYIQHVSGGPQMPQHQAPERLDSPPGTPGKDAAVSTQQTISEEQAKILADLITQTGEKHGFDLYGEVVQLNDTGGWKAVASWRASIWKNSLRLDIFSEEHWDKSFHSWARLIWGYAEHRKKIEARKARNGF
jgi:hypothetical protein